MKNLITSLLLIFILVGRAQSPIKPLFGKGGNNISGAYYKDLDNDFDNFQGTWLYSNGTTSLKIVFQKKEQIFISDYSAYYDMIVGEYQYIENGFEKVNTLSVLNSPPIDLFYHNIGGYIIIKKDAAPVCNDCTVNERRLFLHFYDPTRPGIQEGLTGSLIVKRADVGSVQKIKIILRQTSSVIPDENETLTYNAFNLPWGEYTLTKVN